MDTISLAASSHTSGGSYSEGGNDHAVPHALPHGTEARNALIDDITDDEYLLEEQGSVCSHHSRTTPAMAPLYVPSGAATISNVATDPVTGRPLWGSSTHSASASAIQALHEELDELHHGVQPPGGQHHRNTLVFTARKRKNPLYIAVAVFCFIGMYLYSKSHAVLHGALDEVTELADQRRRLQSQFVSAEEDIKRLQKELGSLRVEGQELGLNDLFAGATPSGNMNNIGPAFPTSDPDGREGAVNEYMQMREKIEEGTTQIGSLQRHVQAASKRDAIEKYGAGVIRVGLELEFPDGKEGPHEIILEMASLDAMPHSVFIFLEMVHAGLFDGCSFILNALHVIKAAPLPYDGSSPSAKVKAFTKLGLESVAFREYSDQYPHDQYTVGFAADGSPSFYINTQDNRDVHVGDPCFAKIVSGLETVQRLEKEPTREGIWYRQRIGLKRATILG